MKKTDVTYQEITMTEKPGHFEKGIWVEDSPVKAPQADGGAVDRKLSEATKAVKSSIDNVMTVTHGLVATPEGKQFIETTIKDTQKHIELSFNAIISRAKAELDKTKTGLDKAKADLDKRAAEPDKIKDELNKKVAELTESVSHPDKIKDELPTRTRSGTSCTRKWPS